MHESFYPLLLIHQTPVVLRTFQRGLMQTDYSGPLPEVFGSPPISDHQFGKTAPQAGPPPRLVPSYCSSPLFVRPTSNFIKYISAAFPPIPPFSSEGLVNLTYSSSSSMISFSVANPFDFLLSPVVSFQFYSFVFKICFDFIYLKYLSFVKVCFNLNFCLKLKVFSFNFLSFLNILVVLKICVYFFWFLNNYFCLRICFNYLCFLKNVFLILVF